MKLNNIYGIEQFKIGKESDCEYKRCFRGVI